MIYHTHKVKYKKSTDKFKLIPLADWHLGERGHCSSHLSRFLTEHDGPNTLYIGNGDLLSCIVPGDPRYDKAQDACNGTDIIDDQIDACVKILTGLKGTIIGLGEGNHEFNYRKKRGHTNPVKTVCNELGVPYIGYSRITKLVFSMGGSRGRTIHIYSHHGHGGCCATVGGCINKYKRKMYNFEAEVLMYAHDHQLFAKHFPSIAYGGIEKGKWLVFCGSFLKTYEDGEEASYGEKAGYDPLVIGAPVIHLQPTQDWMKVEVVT